MIEFTTKDGTVIKDKVCINCRESKPLDAFNKSGTGTYGLHNYCKVCISQYNKKGYRKNRREKIKKSVEWNNGHKDKLKEYQENFREKQNKGIDIPD